MPDVHFTNLRPATRCATAAKAPTAAMPVITVEDRELGRATVQPAG
jgi:hypothetical protein